MRRITTTLLLVGIAAVWALPAHSQAKRLDYVWARQTTNPITLDGVLNEADWSKADSLFLKFGIDNGVPGSGWKIEAGLLPSDSTYAVLKLLVRNNQMFLGARVKDKSVGGSANFNRFDGLLMALKDHMSTGAPKPPDEYFYVWWSPGTTDPQPAGQSPNFLGKWGNFDLTPRTPAQIAAWDAVTVVNGQSNNDAILDTGYTVEMKFDLGVEGYHTDAPAGDIIEWNISIYDCDYFWPLDGFKFSSFRTWLQSPWGNAFWYNELKVYSKPSVTTTSGPAPYVGPEVILPNAATSPAPTIDGALTEPVWAALPATRINYGNDAVRAAYPGVGPYRSGQYQPPVNGGQALIQDPGDADLKMFTRGNFLYLGFNVRDQFVQYSSTIDRMDGAIISINDRVAKNSDNVLLPQRLSYQVAANGTATPLDYLLTLVNAGKAQVAVHLNAGTTVDTLGLQADNGYTVEVAIDLTALGYPSGLGDRQLWIGVDLQDGDSLTPYTDSYATRTWWFREFEGQCCPAVVYMSNAPVSGVGDITPPQQGGDQLMGAYPNPAVLQTLRFSMEKPGLVDLEVFDVGGRLVERKAMGLQPAGVREVQYDGHGLADGLYLYRIRISEPGDGSLRAALPGRMIVQR